MVKKENKKYLNPTVEMNANDLFEKAGISLEQTGNFSLGFTHISQDGVDLNEIAKVFQLSVKTIRLKCGACGGNFYIFSTFENIKDEKGLCNECGRIAILMIKFGIDQKDIVNWMKSDGKVNPLELIQNHLKGEK